jgi:type II secretory pathway component PulM
VHRSNSIVGWGGALLLLALAALSLAQPPDYDVRKEIETLKKGQQAIQKQLQEIRQLLRGRRTQRRAISNVSGKVFNLGDNPIKGDLTAGLTLIDFTDYQ